MKRNYAKMRRELDKMSEDPNYIPPVEASKMYLIDEPLPHERAVMILSRCYQFQEDPDYVSVSWPNQVKAADYYNANGLAKTLDECLRINPNSLGDR